VDSGGSAAGAEVRVTRRRLIIAGAVLFAAACGGSSTIPGTATPVTAYYPDPGEAWQRRRPAEVGMDSAALAGAQSFAQKSEISWSLDMKAQLATNTAREPHPEIVGPFKDRGRQNGIILRHGYIVAEWGDTRRVDMTFSVAKSYLSTVAGVAFDRGLIKDLDEPIGRTVSDDGYTSAHNAPITWRMHLTQTSEWEGNLWGKPDRADRREGYDRTLQVPGTFYEYNDVRVNRLALSLLRRWNSPLPEVLKREIMDPIGATSTWEWHGYRTSMIEQGGRTIESVSGGGHWGGGVWASTRDHARFGYLFLRRGQWKGKQLLSDTWITLATTPSQLRPGYGFLWWLNTGQTMYPAASPRSYYARGAGGNVIWVDPDNDLVAVVRWTDTTKINEFIKLVLASIAK
jgi:CubicO group peptidase (beta-lactamase class C family)